MIRLVSAVALATATLATPAFAQGETVVSAPVASVAAPGVIPSAGLGGAAIVGGVAAIGVIGIAALAASDDDDSTDGSVDGSTDGS